MKKIAKGVLILIVMIVGMGIWFDQSRSFFKASNGEYITMWKRLGGTCYLIPGKYYGLIKPGDGYIKTENKNESVAFYWKNNKANDLLYFGNLGDTIYNTDKTRFRIINYQDNEQENDSLFTEKYGYYGRYKKGVVFLNLNILEGYAGSGSGGEQ